MTRLSKRQQREQEELLALTNSELSHATQTIDQQRSSEEEPLAPTKAGFAALFTAEDEPDVGVSDVEDTAKHSASRKTKKRRKKVPGPVRDEEGRTAHTASPLPQTASQPKHVSKRVKAKGKKSDEKDDLDKALAELSVAYPDLQHIAQRTSTDTRTAKLSSLFSVSVTHLDAESELKRFFGSKAVSAARASTSTRSPGKRRRGIQPQIQRSQLTRPQSSWGMVEQREGLSARALTDEETARKTNKGPAGLGKWWTVEYSKSYKEVTRRFMRAVLLGDPGALLGVLQDMPWHADTLLQLAEVCRHREEYSQAVDYVSRALYAYERAFLGAFSFTNGNNRLDFDRVENRPLFLAIHRQVIDLQRRGCPRTSFEHARLLISLEPLSDPHGAYLHFDYLCVKAGLGDWFLDVWNVYRSATPEDLGEYLDPSALPGWSYARALILRAEEKEKKNRGEEFMEESTEALRQAILEFPSIVPLLADKCEISLPMEVRGHKAFRICTDRIGLSPEESILHLLSHLYVQRSYPLWKSSGHASWFSNTVNSLLPTLSSRRTHPIRDRFYRIFSSITLRYSIYRHVFVLEQTHAQPQNRTLTAFIPPDITQGEHLACDPLPPPSSISAYDLDFLGRHPDPIVSDRPRRRTEAEEREIARLIPDPAVRAQILAFYDQVPFLVDRVPLLEFVQGIPEEELLELMMDIGGANQQLGIAAEDMPGGYPEEAQERMWLEEELAEGGVDDVLWDQQNHQDERADTEEEEEEEEDVIPMPIRVVRNLLNRLWGGAPAQEDSSDEDGADSD